MKIRTSLLLLSLIVLLCSCRHKDYVPKPQAYLRIDLPAAQYHCITSIDNFALPFSFEMNNQATVTLKKRTTRDVWVDINYPRWNGVIFLSHKNIHGINDLRGQTDTSARLLESHYQFASGVDEGNYDNPDKRVFGTTYHLRGNKVASTYQFWVTDSIHHFLRGALYLNQTPNNDSLAPILDYIQSDIDHLIETLAWK